MTPPVAAGAPADEQALTSLSQAFERFSEAARLLEEQQRALQRRIAALDLELAEANDQLAASLDAQSRLANGLHNVLENLATGVIAVDPEGRVTTLNSAALRLLGIGDERQALGRPALDVVAPLRVPELATLIASGWEPARVFEARVTDRSDPGADAADPDGQGTRHLRLRASPARDVQTGHPVGGILVIEDVTALVKWRERALLNERLSTMGRVAAQVAHEIRNPLGSIELLASALVRELRADGDRPETPLADAARRSGAGGQAREANGAGRAGELAAHIVASVRTLDALVSNILLFARGREPEVAPVTWESIAAQALRQVGPALAEIGASVEQRWPLAPVAVLGDGDLLVQAVVNLLINARQALADTHGPRVITLESGGDDAGAWLRVSDTGPGVPESLRQRIFDPFVTTRRRGTGLGLAIVAHIVSAHRGRISCAQGPGGGALFEVWLPRVGAADAAQREGTHG